MASGHQWYVFILCRAASATGLDGMCLPLMGGLPLSAFTYSVAVSTRAGRRPLLPLYALLLFSVPEVLTLRTLYEFVAFGERTKGRRAQCTFKAHPDVVTASSGRTVSHPFAATRR